MFCPRHIHRYHWTFRISNACLSHQCLIQMVILYVYENLPKASLHDSSFYYSFAVCFMLINSTFVPSKSYGMTLDQWV